MNRCAASARLFALAVVPAALAGTPACPEAGTVLSEVKISETSGGFGGALDPADRFGRALASLGDLDGDGVPDLVVGADGDNDGGNDRGAVWILFMNAEGTVESEQKISDSAGGFDGVLDNGDAFGAYVASLGDLDGDGVIDLAVGAPADDDGGTDRGAVWILFLNTDGTVKGEQKISDAVGGFDGVLDNSDLFGISVAGLGDLDGDGVNDLAVGALLDDDGGSDRGAVWILLLNTDGTVKADHKISDTAGTFDGVLDNNDQFGTSAAGIGDLDGDEVADLVVGAYIDDDGGADRGAVWVLFLNANGTVKSEQKISDTTGGFDGLLDDNDRFGISVGNLGDLDGDSVPDLAVGAYVDDDGGVDRGAAWILFLNSNGTVKSDQKISDTAGGFNGLLDDDDRFGINVGSIGDLDGDGVIELAVGANLDDDGDADAGAVWILSIDRCEQEPIITSQPESIVLPVGGGSAQFTIAADGAEPLDYQWRRDGVDLMDGGAVSGATTASLSVLASSEDVGLYDCVVSNAVDVATSDAAVLAVRASCAGDADGDGDIDFDDLNMVLVGFATVCTP